MTDRADGGTTPENSMNEVLRPSGWPRPSGYSDGMAARGRHVFVAGQVGWDPVAHEFGSDDFADQARVAMQNVVAVLGAAGATPQHVVRMTWFITSITEYAMARDTLGSAFRSLFGQHYPAITLVQVSALLEPHAKVEIEATAVVPD
jgi:enamine deaminase RidA (YjgF/YER057c/UK114 family)